MAPKIAIPGRKFCNGSLFPKAAAKGSFKKKRCHSRLSLKTAQSSAEVMAVVKDCQQRLL